MCDCCERSKATGDTPVEEEPVEDRGLLVDDAAEKAYSAFIAGGLFGVLVSFTISTIIRLYVR